MFDSRGDHPYTNYKDTYMTLVRLGYIVEISRGPWTCFDASLYGLLVICDIEEILLQSEIDKIVTDVTEKGISLFIIGEWHDEYTLQNLPFFDKNTRSMWYPICGGSNIPQVNKLLNRFGGEFGYQSFSGSFYAERDKVCIK